MANRLDEISRIRWLKVGNHYETPLPLRDPEMILLNTRVLAEKRAHCLKRQFHKDEQYFSHYKDLMNEIIEKGYGRVLDRIPVRGKL